MDHPTRDSGLALGHEGERQQELHSTEQRRGEQRNDGEDILYTEQQQQQDTEGGGSVRLGTATRGETIGHEDDAGREPRLERAQSPASDLARRERELPRVPPYYTGSIADSQIQQSTVQDSQQQPPDRQSIPPSNATPAFFSQIPAISLSSQDPQVPQTSYNPIGTTGEPGHGRGNLVYDIVNATMNASAQHLQPELQHFQSQLQSEYGQLQAGVQSQLRRNPSLNFAKDIAAAAIGGAVGANTGAGGAPAVIQSQITSQPQAPGSHSFFSDITSSLRPVLVGAAAEAGANAVSRLTKTGGNLQGQVQQELQNQASQHPAGAGFFRELASNMFSHGSHSGQHGDIVNVQQPGSGQGVTAAGVGSANTGTVPLGSTGNAGIWAGAEREQRHANRTSTLPLSSNVAQSPVSLSTDERAPTHPPVQVRDFSNVPGQYATSQQRQHQSSLPPQNPQSVYYTDLPQARLDGGGGGRNGGGSRGSREDDRVSRHRSQRSHLDWIVPVNGNANALVDEKPGSHKGPRTVAERLKSTRDNAFAEERKYTVKAVRTGYTLNAAIGLQVLLNALITGLAAAGSGRLAVSVLGGVGTVVASYLARARGTNEPEASKNRATDLQKFLRDIDAFIEDYGYSEGHEYDSQISAYRDRFEKLLGNTTEDDEKLKGKTPNALEKV